MRPDAKLTPTNTMSSNGLRGHMKYFAYGSNMDPQRMRERGVSFSQRKRAILKGYVLSFNKVGLDNPREGKGNITKNENEVVEGALYGIHDSDLTKLDVAEGFPDHYDHVAVVVELEDGTIVQALAYVAQSSKIRDGLKPKREYLSHYFAADDLLSTPYVQKLRSIETLD